MGYPLTIDAEMVVPAATAQLVHFRAARPVQGVVMRERDSYWLDMCLTPRPLNARACYHHHWSADRFERLGQLFMLPPGESIKTAGEGGPAQASVLCHLRPESIREWFDGDLHLRRTDRHLQASLDVRDANVRGLMRRLGQELREPGFASQMMVELMAAQLAIELRRYGDTLTESTANGGLSGWRLRLIDERLREVREAPTLAELAALCRLSLRQLTRSFRVSRGYSIGEYVASSRLDHAKGLLATDRSVKNIAYSLGFSSPSSFCCAFRRSTLQTPTQYRQRMLSKS